MRRAGGTRREPRSGSELPNRRAERGASLKLRIIRVKADARTCGASRSRRSGRAGDPSLLAWQGGYYPLAYYPTKVTDCSRLLGTDQEVAMSAMAEGLPLPFEVVTETEV